VTAAERALLLTVAMELNMQLQRREDSPAKDELEARWLAISTDLRRLRDELGHSTPGWPYKPAEPAEPARHVYAVKSVAVDDEWIYVVAFDRLWRRPKYAPETSFWRMVPTPSTLDYQASIGDKP
jgi:hypothetical protein